jgi:phospholipase/carboxylesterase
MREERFGGLRARVAGGVDRDGGGDGPVVVLMHGFGAPGDDLVPVGRVLDVPRETRFVYPEAPLALPARFGGGRAWWMIDLDRIARIVAGGGAGDTRLDDEPVPGLEEARAMVSALLDEVEVQLHAPSIVLGGFSQGAMLACDVALHRMRPPAGLVLMLPFAAAERLRDLLTEGGALVDWVPFNGGHEIPERVLDRAAVLVNAVGA